MLKLHRVENFLLWSISISLKNKSLFHKRAVQCIHAHIFKLFYFCCCFYVHKLYFLGVIYVIVFPVWGAYLTFHVLLVQNVHIIHLDMYSTYFTCKVFRNKLTYHLTGAVDLPWYVLLLCVVAGLILIPCCLPRIIFCCL